MAAMALLPELARDSHLDTHVTPEHCIHSFVESPTITRREVWKRTKHIGTGGFGTVWLETCIQGHEKEDGALRAVKVLQLPPGAQVDPQRGIITYGRELEALAKFSHKKYSRCFVKFHGWYEHASTVSICLDYLPLGDLRTFLAKRSDPRLPEPEVQQIISQVLDGLVFMHTAGFAHRDLKPSNILIQTPGPDSWWVKLSDFGLSKRTEETRGATGPLGTPGFMAPELLGLVPNAPKTSNEIKWCPADLWCLGETAFQLLTGKPTFPDLGTLAEYGGGRCEFPASKLHDAMASLAMVEFVSMIMFADYTQRPTAEAASAHRWLQDYKAASLQLPPSLSNAKFDSSQDPKLHSEQSSVSDYTESEIVYRDWSTVTGAPAISPHVPRSLDPATLSWERTASATKPIVDTSARTAHQIRDQGLNRTAIVQMSSAPAPPLSLAKIPPVPFSDPRSYEEEPPQPGARSPIRVSVDMSAVESESDLAAKAQQALASAARWYCGDRAPPTRTRRSTVIDLALSIRETQRQIMIPAKLIDELTGASPTALAEVFSLTILKGMQLGDRRQLIFSPDSKTLATTSSDNSVGLWSTKELALVRTIKGAGEYAAFSSQTQRLAAVTKTGTACLVDPSLDGSGSHGNLRVKEKLIGTAEEVCCAAFSPAGDQLVAGTSMGALLVWDITKAKMIKKIKAQSSAILWVSYYPYFDYKLIPEYDIVAAGEDGWLCFWRHEARSILSDRWFAIDKGGEMNKRGLRVLETRISTLAVSKSFARLAVAGRDGSLAVWHNRAGEHWLWGLSTESVLKGHDESIVSMSFSPNSELLASASRGAVKIWQVRRGLPVATIRAQSALVAFSPDSSSLASISPGNVVRLWNAKRIQNLSDIQDHLDRASFVAVSPDRRYLASIIRELRNEVQDEDNNPGFYRQMTQENYDLYKQRLPVDTDVATLMIWDVGRARALTLLSVDKTEILSVSFSEDSRRIGSISTDHILRIWDVETGKCLETIKPLTETTHRTPCAALSAGLHYCAAVFRYDIYEKVTYRIRGYSESKFSGFGISLFDIRAPDEDTQHESIRDRSDIPCKTLIYAAMGDEMLALTFSPDATRLATVDQNDIVTLWDTASGALVARLSDFSQSRPRYGNPAKFAYDVPIQNFPEYRAHVRKAGNPTIHFSASGTQLALVSGLSVARFWSIKEGGGLQALRRIGSYGKNNPKNTGGENGSAFVYCGYSTPIAVSPDGTRCVASVDGTQLALWDVGTGDQVARLAEYAELSDALHISFSPDSRWLTTASDKDMVVRDAATGTKRSEITVGVNWPLRMVAFWPDSRYVVSGCQKGMLQFWDIESGAMAKAFEGHMGRRGFVLG